MVLTLAGIKRGWAVEQMPEAHVMSDAIMTPDGKVSACCLGVELY